jgi:hypothetical protein
MDSNPKRMNYQEPLSNQAIAISISESSDLAVLGLASEHLDDAMAEVARYLLAMGARLLYGGDLRAEGFTEVLFELVARHRRDADVGDNRLGVSNFLAWPIHMSMPLEKVDHLSAALEGLADIFYLTEDGAIMTTQERRELQPREVTDHDWRYGLSAMRFRMHRNSDARIVLGGKTTDFKGFMPGVAEETIISLMYGQPIFLLGGFGGCTRDIAESLGLLPMSEQSTSPRSWPFREYFNLFTVESLRNGLTAKENIALAKTVHIDQAITLILRGLLRIQNKLRPKQE